MTMLQWESIQDLLESSALHSESFAAAEGFLRSELPEGPRCLVLDVKLPGVNGLRSGEERAAAIYVFSSKPQPAHLRISCISVGCSATGYKGEAITLPTRMPL